MRIFINKLKVMEKEKFRHYNEVHVRPNRYGGSDCKIVSD